MDHDPELLFNYLNQTRDLFGNRIYLDEQDGENPEQKKCFQNIEKFSEKIFLENVLEKC